MKFVPILLLSLLISACTTTPVPANIPEFPAIGDKLTYKCPDLAVAPESEQLSTLLETVIKNYGEYHKCRAIVDAWNTWYVEQKKIYDKLKNESKSSNP
jgi:hypothetical protein